MTAEVEAWRAGGALEEFRGHSIFVRATPGVGTPLVLLHGFPSSSYDFRHLLGLLGERPTLTFDFIGFGLSDKPRSHRYSLFWQADLVAELVHRHHGDAEVFMVAHDMGTSVATELMAREVDGEPPFNAGGALLFDGNIVLERAKLIPSQRLLRSPLGALLQHLSSQRVFRQQFGSVFSAAHPLTDAEAADQWALVCHNGGRTMGHELIYYLRERSEFAERWHGAIAAWPRALSLTWGMEDPVSPPAVLDALRELRPGVPVTELPGLGHYPQLEDPGAVRAVIKAALGLLPA